MKRLHLRICAHLCLAMGAFSTTLVWAAPYQLMDMGLLPEYGASAAYDVSNTGAVALTFSKPGDSGWQAALYSYPGGLQGLGDARDGSYSSAHGINDQGSLAGEFVTASGNQLAMKTTPNGMLTLGQGVGNAINGAGQVAGRSPGGPTQWSSQATLWSGNTIKPLGVLPGDIRSEGRAINSAGHVVGDSESYGFGSRRGFFYDGVSMHALATLPGGSATNAMGINDQDEITGCATDASSICQAVIWSNGGITLLGTLQNGTASWGKDINNRGQVVGVSHDASGRQVATLYQDGQIIDLNSMLSANQAGDWHLMYANAINDEGWIVGEAMFQGVPRAFLLTPVPEPGATSLMLLGLTGLAGCRWRLRRAGTQASGQRAKAH